LFAFHQKYLKKREWEEETIDGVKKEIESHKMSQERRVKILW
jgi:hypothetical protein